MAIKKSKLKIIGLCVFLLVQIIVGIATSSYENLFLVSEDLRYNLLPSETELPYRNVVATNDWDPLRFGVVTTYGDLGSFDDCTTIESTNDIIDVENHIYFSLDNTFIISMEFTMVMFGGGSDSVKLLNHDTQVWVPFNTVNFPNCEIPSNFYYDGSSGDYVVKVRILWFQSSPFSIEIYLLYLTLYEGELPEGFTLSSDADPGGGYDNDGDLTLDWSQDNLIYADLFEIYEEETPNPILIDTVGGTTYTYFLSGISDGSHTYYIAAEYGTVYANSTNVDIFVDTSPPVLSDELEINYVIYDKSYEFNLTAVDSNGISSAEIIIENDQGSQTFSMTNKPSSDTYYVIVGPQTIDPKAFQYWYKITDGIGNVAESIRFSISVSTDPLLIVIGDIFNYELESINNYAYFTIYSDFPDFYNVYIDDLVTPIKTDVFLDGVQESVLIDGYGIGTYVLMVEGFDKSGKYGSESKTFEVYSDSATIINVLHLEGYRWKSVGNTIQFNISSQFPDVYEFYINDILIQAGSYYDGQTFEISIDNYGLGDHDITIWATGRDGHECTWTGSFSVYSDSATTINVIELSGYRWKTTGNRLKFNITSQYPDVFNLTIDGALIDEASYTNDTMFDYSIDGYDLGDHNIKIWAIGEDGHEGMWIGIFTVFSDSVTIINIIELNDYEWLTTGNRLRFNVTSQYPDVFELWINEVLIDQGSYTNNTIFDYSIDGYDIGTHDVTIWASGEDNNNYTLNTSFDVITVSVTIINVLDIDNYLYNSTETNNVTFQIFGSYGGSYNLSIDDESIILNEPFSDGEIFRYNISDYSVGIHIVKIRAMGLDGIEATAFVQFNVYAQSVLSVNIVECYGYEFTSTGNYAKFNITATFPNSYKVYINGDLLYFGTYVNNEIISVSIDGLEVGIHTITVWANSTDGKYSSDELQFEVYSSSTTEIDILTIELDYEFKSNNNVINFTISSDYPDFYNFSIDGELLYSGPYTSGELLSHNIDGWSVGLHTITIWAIGLDGKEAEHIEQFSVFSTSSTLITIVNIGDFSGYEWQTTGNVVQFKITSLYPDYYMLWIDNVLINSSTFESDKIYNYSIDGLSLGVHTLKIWAIGEDLVESTLEVQFNVYSLSITDILMIELSGYEWLSSGNTIEFNISSDYPDYFKFWIDDILITNGSYVDQSNFVCSIDGCALGNHTVKIWAIGKDLKECCVEIDFDVYSLSSTIVNILELNGYEWLTTGNVIKFNVSSKYPDSYKIWIDDTLLVNGSFVERSIFNCSIDGLSLGIHLIKIWAIGKDGKECYVEADFEVYSLSSTIVNIVELHGYEYMTTGNRLKFEIFSSYPDYFTFSLNDTLIDTGVYESGKKYQYSLDGLNIGDYEVDIWAIGKDKKVSTVTSVFSVYSLSNTSIEILKLEDYDLNSTGNLLMFNISSSYPDYYSLKIDNEVVLNGTYEDGQVISYNIDHYSEGMHNISIHAIGKDGKKATVNNYFIVRVASDVSKASEPSILPMSIIILVSLISVSIVSYIIAYKINKPFGREKESSELLVNDGKEEIEKKVGQQLDNKEVDTDEGVNQELDDPINLYYEEFERNHAGKHAIWRGDVTKQFLIWYENTYGVKET